MSKSNTDNWSDVNPPPPPPYIPSTINSGSAIVSTGSIMSAWPTSEYSSIIYENTTIKYSATPFNFIKTDTTGGAIILTLTEIPTGTMLMCQVLGTNGLTINVIVNETTTITVSTPLVVSGTYIVIVFFDAVKYNTLENPIAV